MQTRCGDGELCIYYCGEKYITHSLLVNPKMWPRRWVVPTIMYFNIYIVIRTRAIDKKVLVLIAIYTGPDTGY